MATAQHGVPVIVMSPAVTGGKSNGYRPLATVDVGFISEHTPGDAVLFDSSAWDDEPAIVEHFRPGRRDGELWTVVDEYHPVRASDVHLAKSAEDLALFMKAIWINTLDNPHLLAWYLPCVQGGFHPSIFFWHSFAASSAFFLMTLIIDNFRKSLCASNLVFSMVSMLVVCVPEQTSRVQLQTPSSS